MSSSRAKGLIEAPVLDFTKFSPLGNLYFKTGLHLFHSLTYLVLFPQFQHFNITCVKIIPLETLTIQLCKRKLNVKKTISKLCVLLGPFKKKGLF